MAQTSALNLSCIHCGADFVGPVSSSFCCKGCEFVYGLIQGEGLGRFYEMRNSNPPVCSIPAQVSKSTFDCFDDPEFIKKISSDGTRIRLYLTGLNCAACLWLLEKLPTFCSDAKAARVNMATSTIEIVRNPEASFAAIVRTLDRLGFSPRALRQSESSLHLQLRERRRDLIRIGVAAAATGNIMILAVSLYGGAAGSLADQFRLLSAMLALPVLTYCAWPFYRSAWAALRARHLNLDLPIVVAIIAGVAASIWGLFGSTNLVYFDSLSMLVFLLLSSRFVLKGVQNRLFQSTNLEDDLLLGTVQKIGSDGQKTPVSSLSLVKGDLVCVENNSIVPVDGAVEHGQGSISTAVLTGESEAIHLSTGSKVEAGSRNLSGDWTLRVECPPAQTRIAQILRDTEKSAREKSSFVHFSDRISVWFILLVFFAAIALLLYHLQADPIEGIARALALIIVTCPCVFGIAIPLSMSLAIRNAAQRGIIVKNSDAIERLWKIKNLVFDKTGTLTDGKMSVLNVSATDDSVLSIALSLESGQQHPVAIAITSYLVSKQYSIVPTTDLKPLLAGGVSGKFEGVTYSIKPVEQQNSKNEKFGAVITSTFGLFRESEPIAKFELGDTPRPECLSLLRWARRQGYTTQMISGDRKRVVDSCGKLFGFSQSDVQSEATPESKAQRIRAMKSSTAMIGDGANDAAALAAAHVGIAVCGSLEVSLRAADVYLTKPNLNAIADLFEIAKLTRSAIYRNLLFSASFNLVSGTLAATGIMTPLWAAVVMPLSSISVLLSSVWTGNQIRHLKEIV